MKMTHLIDKNDKNGVTFTDIAPSPLALGQLTRGVTVAEITAGYTSLANGGVFNEARTVLKILDADGKVLIDNSGKGERLFSEQSARIMTHLLQGVTESGTASKMTLKNTVDCAGKTGTTTNDCDRWFIGYTPDLLAGVWFGYPTPKSLDGYPTLPSPALKTFDNVMGIINTEEYLGRAVQRHFNEVDGVITAKYCKDSGKLVNSACMCDPRGSRVETGYFTRDTLPTEYCDTHTLVLYDVKNGGIASPDCPKESCRYVGLLNVKRYFAYPTVILDAQYTVQRLESGVPPCFDASKPYFYFNSGGAHTGTSYVNFPFNRYCSCNMPKPPEEDFEDGEIPNEE
jgi:penicillin-binding protein 1A